MENPDSAEDESPEPGSRKLNVRRSSTKLEQLKFSDAPPYQIFMATRYPKFVEFVEGNGFETAMGVIIMYNCVTIGVEVHMCPPETSMRSGNDCPLDFLTASEHVCTAIFVFEFMLRGLCCGFKYHVSGWDKIFDVGLVWGTGVLLSWIVVPIMGSGPSEVRMLTALRAFRLLRVARVIRFNFKEMWLMLRGLAGSSKALLSMIAVFVFVFYLFGILAVTLIGDAQLDQTDEEIMGVHEFFNGLDKSMWTLLQMVTADSWSSGIARPVIRAIPAMWMYFSSYIAIAMMVLMNLVTAIIVENAMNQSKEDQEQMLMELEKKRLSEFKHLKKMFIALDQDGSGELDEEEFENALDEQPELIDQFKLLGFGEQETRNFFHDLDNGDGSLSTEEFIGGLQAMQGNARSADLIRTQKMVERLTRRVDRLLKHFSVKDDNFDKDDGENDDDAGMDADETEDQVTNLRYQAPMKAAPLLSQAPMKEAPAPKSHAGNFQPSFPKSDAEEFVYNAPGGVLEVAKQQLAIAQETSMSLDAMSKNLRLQIDKRLNDVQSAVNSNQKTETMEVSKEWLHDVRTSVAEVCRKEISRQLDKMLPIRYDTDLYPAKPLTVPPTLPGAYGPEGLPRTPSLPRKKKATKDNLTTQTSKEEVSLKGKTSTGSENKASSSKINQVLEEAGVLEE